MRPATTTTFTDLQSGKYHLVGGILCQNRLGRYQTDFVLSRSETTQAGFTLQRARLSQSGPQY